MKNILAEATISEELPRDFGIYDLGQFLNGLSLHNNPDLDFQEDNYVVIKEGRSRSKYFFADPQVIVTPPERPMNLPSEDVTFDLSTEQLDKLLKAAAIYQSPDLSVIGENGVVKILPGNYEVVVSSKLLSRFRSKNQDLTYFIALEPDSTFE